MLAPMGALTKIEMMRWYNGMNENEGRAAMSAHGTTDVTT